MKISINSHTLSLALLITLSSISSLSPTQSKTLNPKLNHKNDLIAQTCVRTPNYALCESSLRSNPESSNANLVHLSLIMVGIVKAKANATLVHINVLLKRGSQENLHEALSSCGDNYKAILEADVPEATQAITSGDYKFGEQGMNDASIESDLCEKLFSAGDSPLTELYKNMHDVAAIASSMVRILMTS